MDTETPADVATHRTDRESRSPRHSKRTLFPSSRRPGMLPRRFDGPSCLHRDHGAYRTRDANNAAPVSANAIAVLRDVFTITVMRFFWICSFFFHVQSAATFRAITLRNVAEDSVCFFFFENGSRDSCATPITRGFCARANRVVDEFSTVLVTRESVGDVGLLRRIYSSLQALC